MKVILYSLIVYLTLPGINHSKILSVPRSPHLIVQTIQGKPRQSLELSWTKPFSHYPLLGYLIRYGPKGEAKESFKSIELNENNKILTIGNLDAGVVYEIRIKAKSEVGFSADSVEYIQTLDEENLPSYPLNFTLRIIQDEPIVTILAEWLKPLHTNGAIGGYVIVCKPKEKAKDAVLTIDVNPHNRNQTIGPLEHDTTYKVTIKARNKFGYSQEITETIHTPKETVPSPPKLILKVLEEGPLLNLHIQWAYLPEVHRELQAYRIRYGLQTHSKDVINELKVDGDNYGITINNLEYNADYEIHISGKNKLGWGPEAVENIRMVKEMKMAPQNISYWFESPSVAHVTWDFYPVQKVKSNVTHYTIQLYNLENTTIIPNTNKNYAIFTNLSPDTRHQYIFKVQPHFWKMGEGVWSQEVILCSRNQVPMTRILDLHLDIGKLLNIHLNWSYPICSYGHPKSYRIRFGRKGELEENFSIIFVHGLLDSISILDQDIDNAVVYEFRLCAYHNFCLGPEVIRYIRTSDAAPTAPPDNISYQFITVNSIRITWDPPAFSERRGSIINYSVIFSKKFNSDASIIRTTNNTYFILRGLALNTKYRFCLKAHTVAGGGPCSQDIDFRTVEKALPSPLNVRTLYHDSSSMTVWWDAIAGTQGHEIVGYKIFYTKIPVDDREKWHHVKVDNVTSVILTQLQVDSEYYVEVGALTSRGVGLLSRQEDVQHQDTPTNVQVFSTYTTITLLWEPPMQIQPKKYRISYKGFKEYKDERGRWKVMNQPSRSETIKAEEAPLYLMDNLWSYATYHIKITAVTADATFHPSFKLTMQTKMTDPPPLQTPEIVNVSNNSVKIAIKQASEENGPIKQYFIITTPVDLAKENPDEYRKDEIYSNFYSEDDSSRKSPFISVMLLPNELEEINYLLELTNIDSYFQSNDNIFDLERKYKVFVHAVIDSDEGYYCRSSPYSEAFHLF